MPTALPLSKRLLLSLTVHLGGIVLRALAATWRMSMDTPHYVDAKRRGEKLVGVLWHQSLLVFAWAFRDTGIRVLISRHHDGEIIARITKKLGFEPVRGSTTRGGVAGLKGLIDALAEFDVGVTPDGPRGPRFTVAPGVVEVASASGRRLLLAACAADRAWQVRSWDRFLVPKPFARIRLRFDTVEVPPDLDADAREQMRRGVERRLRELTATLSRELTGVVDPMLEDVAAETRH